MEGIKQLSRVHQEAGNRVEILSCDAPDDPWVKASSFPVHAQGPASRGYGYSSQWATWLRKNRARYDIVVVNGLWQYSALGTWRALRGSKVPYVVFPHGMLDPWFKRAYPLKHLKKWLYWPWADYRVLRDAARVLFTCEEERRLARGSFSLYRANETVVKFGTQGPPEVDGEALRRIIAERWPAAEGKRCLLHLGRVHEKKGTDLVLQAFTSFRRGSGNERNSWHLILAGPADHAYGAEMKALATRLGLDGHVTWTGMVAGETKWAAFHGAEALILPSHQENFGIVVAESLACGRPVLISDKVNIWREILRHEAAFVENDDAAGTLRLMERWAALSVDEREAMGRRARECFRAEFHIESAARSVMEVMEEVVAERKGVISGK